MQGKYFPRYNILLIKGENIFTDAFDCFLEKIYHLSLFLKEQNKVVICLTAETSDILLQCLNHSLENNINKCFLFKKEHKIFCNTVIYFNLKNIESNLEIFNYLERDIIYKIIKKFIKTSKKKKINFFADVICKTLTFASNTIEIEEEPSARLKETLNIINFNLS